MIIRETKLHKARVKILICSLLIGLLLILVATSSLSEEPAEQDNVGYQYYYNQLDPVQKQIYNYIKSLPKETADHNLKIDVDFSTYMDTEGNVFSSQLT